MEGLTWHIIWKCSFIVGFGVILLRWSGRKSIAQMTVATTVVMISIGELMAQGIIENSVLRSIVAVALFVAILFLMEVLVLKNKWMERWITGKPAIIIRDGKVDEKQLKRMRMTYGQLEMRLRQHSITRISDVKTASIEVNGELGYELKPQAQFLTMKMFEQCMQKWGLIPVNDHTYVENIVIETPNIFTESLKLSEKDGLTDNRP
ncbi:DUF421 domain-containing protein [Paenibacillus sp. Soil724D2]|uniref:DUF421 domain-containing protein n=1 Tax=Paenibacillus sp. (strain Soil724D2) TaxID=1736392 RepID=UPI000714DAB4|nr:YetF domain-containing protein [Paenibacillus sp. Soil724D2]KRE46573.1 hypothetical protein ASG85_29685 [Paenibacillus sp. Soil724D2]